MTENDAVTGRKGDSMHDTKGSGNIAKLCEYPVAGLL